jgi:hypothetical protein
LNLKDNRELSLEKTEAFSSIPRLNSVLTYLTLRSLSLDRSQCQKKSLRLSGRNSERRRVYLCVRSALDLFSILSLRIGYLAGAPTLPRRLKPSMSGCSKTSLNMTRQVLILSP